MKLGTSLVVSLFAVLSACALAYPVCSEWLALGLMICAGIPHGSFDLRVAEAKWRGGQVSRKGILVAYLMGVFGMSGLCVFFPLIGISLFLAISALHFSEGECHSSEPPDALRGGLFGIAAILLPIGLHLSESQVYMSYFVSSHTFAALQGALRLSAIALAVVLGGLLTRDLLVGRGWRCPLTIERTVCLIGWIVLPPLGGFAVWFIGRHSRQHLEVCREMFTRGRFAIPLDFAGISLLAIVGLLPFGALFDLSRLDQLFAASICLIAGLTLPHMIVSHRIRDVVAPAKNAS